MATSLANIWIMTRLTFREARRRKMLWLGIGLGLVFVALFSTGFYFAWRDVTHFSPSSSGAERDFMVGIMTSAGLYVVNFLVVMVTALTTVGTIATEIDTNTIHAIAAKPIRRVEIVVGKWLGHAVLVSLYTTLLAVGVMAASWIISGKPVNNAAGVLAILILESLCVLGLTTLGSTLFSALANGVVAFMLYGVAFVGGWVEQIGSLLDSQTAIDIGIASSLLMPSEALWRYAASLLQGAQVFGMDITPFSVSSEPTPAFLVYAGVYALATLAFAIWRFSQRDL